MHNMYTIQTRQLLCREGEQLKGFEIRNKYSNAQFTLLEGKNDDAMCVEHLSGERICASVFVAPREDHTV